MATYTYYEIKTYNLQLSDQQIEKIVNCPHSTYKAFGEHQNIVDKNHLDIKYAFTNRDEFEDILKLIETSFEGASRNIGDWRDEGTGYSANIYYHKGKLYYQTEHDGMMHTSIELKEISTGKEYKAGFGTNEEAEYEFRYESIEKWFDYIMGKSINE